MSHEALDWAAIEGELDALGAAVLPGWFSSAEVQALAAQAPPASLLMPQGGDMLPLALPAPLAQRCEGLLRHLAPLTRRWQVALGLPPRALVRSGCVHRPGCIGCARPTTRRCTNGTTLNPAARCNWWRCCPRPGAIAQAAASC